MTRILHVSCSPRGPASESLRLSSKVVHRLQDAAAAATVVFRNLGAGTLPHVDADYAGSQQAAADVSSMGTASRSAELIAELEDADVVVIGTPLHNYTVPSVLKAWIDHLVRVRHTFDVSPHGKIARLRDRPVFVAVSAGGRFSGAGARQPDFLAPYLEAVLGMIGLRDLTFFAIEGAAFGPEALALARARADEAVEEHFSRRPPFRPHSMSHAGFPGAIL